MVCILGALLQFTGIEEHSSYWNGKPHIPQVTTIVDYVSGWEERETQPNSVLRLRGGPSLLALRNDPRYEAWRHAVGEQQKRKAPVYVEFDPETNLIKALYTSLLRKVESVEDGTNGRTVVIFLRAPSSYFVSKDRADSQKMISLLQAAAKSHQEVLVVFHPSTLEILDLRLPEICGRALPNISTKLRRNDLEEIRNAAIVYFETGKDEFGDAFIAELKRAAIFSDDGAVSIGIWKVRQRGDQADLVRQPPMSSEMHFFGLHLVKRQVGWTVTGDFEERERVGLH